MIIFLVQSFLLIAAAFVIGAVLGRVFKGLSPKTDSASEESTRAADARLAAAVATPANDDVSKPAQAVTPIPPAEPVPAIAAAKVNGVDGKRAEPAEKTKSPARKTAAKSSTGTVSKADEDTQNRPTTLKNARRGKPDHLSDIEGIGNVIESKLFGLGVFHFDQIAAWDADQAAWISREIGFPGRAYRENWMKQATALAKPAPDAAEKTKPATKPVVKRPRKS
ncbi:endonuclease [Phyllobacterium sp. 628]|uniref:endonuclease n=1 Tax=Phyllobacterium sp. 628 TaxID=2718938 RepID=UPI0016623A77|nr:endonuclease [Phyllobacterium sp. 628]QND52456.1 endonuclease [Phyllobacterium sp. 628]